MSVGFPEPPGDLPSLEDADSPNVYWVVVDGYGREDALQELGPTSDLAAGLRGRDFEVDPEAVVPYAWTHLSLGATLSAAYFPQNLTYRELKPVADELFRRGPPAFRAFESAGFSRLLWPGVDWPGFTCEPIDPACLRTLSLAPEDALVSAMTIVGPLRELLSSTPGFIADADPVPAAEEALAIQSSTDGGSRYLTVLHLMGLHPPYRWRGSECVPQPGGLLSEDWLPIEDYVAASRCAAARVLEAIDRILSADPEAVVIVQGDHGPRLLAADWEAIRSTMSVDTAWYGTLLAAKLPGGCSLGSGNNTVNVFRLVFACLADTEPDLLESRSLHFDGEDAVARVVHP